MRSLPRSVHAAGLFPPGDDSLVLLVLVATPGTAALARLARILNIVTVQGRAGSVTLVLAGTLSIVYLAFLTALVRFDDSVRGMTAWSLVACIAVLVLGVQHLNGGSACPRLTHFRTPHQRQPPLLICCSGPRHY